MFYQLVSYICYVQYAINNDTPYPIFQINDHIGYDEEDGKGIDGRVFSKEFFQVDSSQPTVITYYNNSWGGDVKQGIDIATSIRNAKCKTHSIINGFAYSISGVIALMADKVSMYSHASWMCHMVYTASGESSPLIDRTCRMIATMISGCSGKNQKPKKTVEEVLQMMSVETVMDAQQMYDNGLIDEILDSNNTPLLNLKNQYKNQQILLNKFIQTKTVKDMSYTKLFNRLDLSENSTENDILGKVAGFENKIKATENEALELRNKLKLSNESQEELQTRMKKMQNDMSEMETELANKKKLEQNLIDMETSCNDMKNTIKLHADEKAALELKNREDKADAYLKEMTDKGKVKDDVAVQKIWREKLVNDFDGTSLIMDMAPVNKKLPVIIDPRAPQTDLLNEDMSDEQLREYNRKLRENKK